VFMSERENFIRTLTFDNPQWIPTTEWMDFYPATWAKYREDLEELVLRFPLVFGDYQRRSTGFDEPSQAYREGYTTDAWGCVWYTAPGQGGLLGQVEKPALADWETLSKYEPPGPDKNEWGETLDWEEIRTDIETQRDLGKLTWGNGGYLFDRLYYLRGFENLMIDFATDAPQLPRLIEMVTDRTMEVVNKWLTIGVDVMAFHTDIASQQSLMISPGDFRRYIKPMFKALFTACRDAGTHVYLSSDGRMLDIVDDLIECGVSVHDPEVGANTLEGIARAYKGKMCAMVYIDPQKLPFWKPDQIRAHVREIVTQVGSPDGGLVLAAWPTPDVPLENIEAMALAIEEYRTYWWDGRG